jgi:hypothetical protein
MKPIRIAWCLAAAALALGCQDQVTEPAAEAETVDLPAFKAEHVDYEQEYYYNEIFYYSCLGENVWERGRMLAYKGRVFQPSGNANRWTWWFDFYGLPSDDPYYAGEAYTLLGLTSGDLWTLEKTTKADGGRRHDKEDGFIYHQALNRWFRNQDGDKLHYHEVYTLHCDYDWNCSLEKVAGSCPTEFIDDGPPDPLP